MLVASSTEVEKAMLPGFEPFLDFDTLQIACCISNFAVLNVFKSPNGKSMKEID